MKNKKKARKKIGKETIRNAFSLQLLQAVYDVCSEQEKLFEDPGDIECIHKYRVSLRTLRAFFSFVKPVMDPALYAKIIEKLKALANEFSYIRELDVLLGKWFSDESEETDESQRLISKLEELLRSERQKEQDRLSEVISNYSAMPQLLEIWGAVFKDELWLPKSDSSFDKFAERRFKTWGKKFNKGLKTESFSDLKATHQLRILGKKVRYVQDNFFSDQKITYALKRSELKELLELFGKLNDASRNVELIESLMRSHPTPVLQQECHQLIRSLNDELNEIKSTIRKDFK